MNTLIAILVGANLAFLFLLSAGVILGARQKKDSKGRR